MTVRAAIVHRLPGRIRLRLQEKRGDADFFSMLSADFSGLDGVQHVKTNASTGSIVIEFSGTQEALVERLREHDVVVEALENGHAAHGGMPKAIDMHPLLLVSGRNINAMFMIGTLLVVAGIVQTLRGKIVAPALPTFWAALEAFRRSRHGR